MGGEYSTSQNVVDFLALIDRLNGPVRVLAHSFGGHVTFISAGAYPERFHSIIAIEGRLAGMPEPRRFTPEGLRDYVDARRSLESRTPRVYPNIDAATARVAEQNPRLTTTTARHIAEHAVRAEQSDEVEGGEGYMQDAVQHFPDARALVVPGAGHWVHHDDPEFVIETARKFFA